MKLKRMGRLVERREKKGVCSFDYRGSSRIRRGWGGTGDGMVPSLIFIGTFGQWPRSPL